jgi:AcrR family transcriptional regulator
LTGLRERRKQGTRQALEEAALHRFAREGFDATTVEAIAADVGVSARTFFRYFGSKEDVLYVERTSRQAALHAGVLAAPPSVAPLAALHVGLLAAAPSFDRDQTLLQERAASRSAVLRGRQAEVVQSWEVAMADALLARGAVGDVDVVSAVGVAAFRTAVTRWLRDPRPLAEHLDEVFRALSAGRASG